VQAAETTGETAEQIEIRFEPSHRSVRVSPGTSLLEAARRAQLPIASACGADGVCARCGLLILAGEASLPQETERERAIKSQNRIDPKLRLACRVAVVSELTATAPYW
jgi:ferredoxin